ncbi:hypothetical protein ACI0FM_04745 [Paenochrobactrum sp. BZR 588]
MRLAVKLRFEALLTALRLKSLALAERNWREQKTISQEERED